MCGTIKTMKEGRVASEKRPRRPKRDFWLLDGNRQPTGRTFRSVQPRGAALKAAVRGFTEIVLLEGNQMWFFDGTRSPRPKSHHAICGFGIGEGQTLWESQATETGTETLDDDTAKHLALACMAAKAEQ